MVGKGAEAIFRVSGVSPETDLRLNECGCSEVTRWVTLRLEGRFGELEGRGHDQWYEQELEGYVYMIIAGM
jgi:hypothetical protein